MRGTNVGSSRAPWWRLISIYWIVIVPAGAQLNTLPTMGLSLRAVLIGVAVGALLMFAIDAFRPETSRGMQWLYACIAGAVVAAFVQGRLDKSR